MSRRKVEMILELVDRATRPARRFIRLQQRMGKAVELANRIAARSARMASRATDLYKRATQGLSRAQDALQRGIRRSNDLIRRQVTQMRTATGMMGRGVMGAGRAALIAGGMFAAYAGTVSLAASSFIGPARQFENFGVQLESIEGSSAKAQKAMSWIEKFATSTPLELNQVVEAYQQMRTFGMDPTNGSMMALVDTMAASGKGAEQLNGLVLALGKSWTKGKLQGEEIMMLMERGVPVYDILGEKLGKTALQIQKMATAGKLGRKEIQMLIDGMAENNAGASEKMSKTWDGIMSNLMDWWTRFQRTVMGFGVFDWMKDKLRGVLDMLNAMEASGELEVWAKAIADNLLIGLNAIWDFGAAAVRFWQTLYPWIERARDALGGWRNLALAVLAIPFRGVLLGAAFSLVQFAGGAALAAKALIGIGFGGAASGAMWFGKVLLGLINPMKWVRAALFALRIAVISTGIGAILVGIAMAGVWIYKNWAGLKSFFKGFGETFMKSLGPARPLAEGVISVVRRLFGWIKNLIKPLDASTEQWRDWGRAAGRFVGDAVAIIGRFVGRIKAWFGRMGQINWRAVFSMATLRNAWAAVKAWVTDAFDKIWVGLKSVKWADLLTLDGLKTAFRNITNWIGQKALALWDKFSPLAWYDLVTSDDLSSAWTSVTSFITGKASSIWSKIKKMPWVEKLNDSALPKCWGKVTTFLTGAGSKLWGHIKKFKGWCDAIDKEGIKTAWADITTWLSGAGTSIWENVKAIDWNAKLADLESNWNATTAFVGQVGGEIWTGIKNVDWDTIVSGLGQAWTKSVEVHSAVRAKIWAGIKGINWAELIDLQGIKDAWTSVTTWFGDAAAKLWDLLPEMPSWKFSLWGDNKIEDPKTLLAAAKAASRLETQFPALQQAAQTTLASVQTNLAAISALMTSADYTSQGERMMQSLADGIRAKLTEVTAAALEITSAIRNALPSTATLNVGVKGSAPVQARASGGAFNPGWLLTGEQGPELEYRNRSGFIAHNAALQNMMAMSQSIAKSPMAGMHSANANIAPRMAKASSWLKGASLASGIAASSAMSAAAHDASPDVATDSAVPVGAKYLNERNSGQGSRGPISLNMTFNGTVDRQALPDIQAMNDEMLETILERLEDSNRATTRRENK